MNKELLEFIQRRFQKNSDWLTGNCYYFAVILKNRFPEGKIYYDVTTGHFLFQYEDKYYDWTGMVNLYGELIEWDKFEEYDSLQKERIIRDCIL